MSTQAQISANRENAKHSSGPATEAGKAVSCKNNFRYGFCGSFTVLPSEHQEEYDTLFAGLKAEHKPSTVTETILIEKMTQHLWLCRRAQTLQDVTMAAEMDMRDQERQFALFLRYETTHDRGFHKCLATLLKLRAEKRRAEIGFESQKRSEAQEARRAAREIREQQLHEPTLWLLQAKGEYQELKNLQVDAGPNQLSDRAKRILAREQAA
jgi:hypothetical protein